MEGAEPVLLLGCVKKKRATPAPARDLYVSPLWRARREYAEASGRPWFVLSALHGLVDPTRQLEPYDLALNDRPAAERREWGAQVIADLERVAGPLRGRELEVHAGGAYVRALAGPAAARGATIQAPLATAAGIGVQLGWYAQAKEASSTRGPSTRRQMCEGSEVDQALNVLSPTAARIAPTEWKIQGRKYDTPGLYAWYVDDVGAVHLAAGLGEDLSPGLIYGGQTGATKWPSGTTGRNTLRSRIVQHVAGRIRGSTFRLTLASVLSANEGLALASPKVLTPESEKLLTAWIMDHLEVAVHSFPDADALASLEDRVLEKLDPPLNLEGMSATPVRQRLSSLRSALASNSAVIT